MFHDTVNKSVRQRSILAKCVEACDALKVVATSDIILNISDGHNQGVLHINEDDPLMEHIRMFAEAKFIAARKAVEEANG